MVGDIGYGAVLLGPAFLVRRRRRRSPAVRDLSRVSSRARLVDRLRHPLRRSARRPRETRLGLPASGSTRRRGRLEPLLLFALALGAVHVVLGPRARRLAFGPTVAGAELLERSGSLLALGGVFGLAGVAADRLPGARSLRPRRRRVGARRARCPCTGPSA